MADGWIAADRGKCPHCGDSVRFERVPMMEAGRDSLLRGIGQEPAIAICPSCRSAVVDWVWKTWAKNRPGGALLQTEVKRMGVYPRSRRAVIPSEVASAVPAGARDYMEAVEVMEISRRAAAALARRALQVALRAASFTHPSRKLDKEIEVALQDPRTSATLGEKLRFVQHVGNDAAHPNVDFQGDLVEVTSEDLEVILAALEEFFDAYFVKPLRHAAVMEAQKKRKRGA